MILAVNNAAKAAPKVPAAIIMFIQLATGSFSPKIIQAGSAITYQSP